MIKGIGHVAFNVKDMEKTVSFYEKTIGFKKAFDIPRPENGEPWIVYIWRWRAVYRAILWSNKGDSL